MVTPAAMAAVPGPAKAGLSVFGIVELVVIGSWILMFALLIGMGSVIYRARRRSGRRAAAAAASAPPARLLAAPPGLAALRRADPNFDEQVLLDAALTATLLVFAATTTGDVSPLGRLVTDSFWRTPFGTITSTAARDRRREAIQAARDASRPSSARWYIPIDYHPSVPELVAVDLGARQRVSVRVAFGQLQAIVRPAAAQFAAGASAPSFTSAVISIAGSVTAEINGPRPSEVSWVASGGHYDLRFVRPARARTDPAAALSDRTCPACGATYRSELAVGCAHCRAARPLPWGQWRLAEAIPVR
jgi:hypothetical protein